MWNPFQKKLDPVRERQIIENESLEGAFMFIRVMASHPEAISDTALRQEMRNFLSSTEARAEEFLVRAAALIRKERPDGFKIYQDAAREAKSDSILTRVFLSPMWDDKK